MRGRIVIELFKKPIGRSRMLLGAMFLLNPSPDFLKEDYKDLIQKDFVVERPFELGNDYFKSPEEIDSFILASNGVRKENLSSYFESYKPLLLSASNVFRIPFSFQSCLIYKESRFNRKALSPVGAMGVAQFTRATYEFLVRALNIGRSHRHKEGEYLLEKGFVFKLVHSDSDKQNLSYMKYNTHVFGEMFDLWQAYLLSNNLDEPQLENKDYKKVLYSPDYAIGLSAMYLHYLKHRMNYSIKASEDKLEDPNFILVMAGAYNQGVGRALRVAKTAKENTNFSNLISYQSKVRETRDYIKSIKTCMRRDHKSLPKQEVGLEEASSFAETADM